MVTDEISWVARWRDGGSMPSDRPVRVGVQMKNVRLFSLENSATRR